MAKVHTANGSKAQGSLGESRTVGWSIKTINRSQHISTTSECSGHIAGNGGVRREEKWRRSRKRKKRWEKRRFWCQKFSLQWRMKSYKDNITITRNLGQSVPAWAGSSVTTTPVGIGNFKIVSVSQFWWENSYTKRKMGDMNVE